MKKQILNIVKQTVKLRFLVLAAFVIFAVSCEKEDSLMMEKSQSAEMAGIEDAELKRGNRAPAPGDQSIAEIAIGAGFTELVAALVYVDEELDAGLVNLFLNGKDQYTVFAPTNEAFEGLYDFLGIDEITDLPAELVLDVLLYHVAEGRRAANSVVPPRGTRTITTLLGATFSVNTSGVITDKFGQSVTIETPNISASNGIIHIIDTVLLPL
jgi:uncharacterized surface protein with fasciclin (FAS1) repeats